MCVRVAKSRGANAYKRIRGFIGYFRMEHGPAILAPQIVGARIAGVSGCGGRANTIPHAATHGHVCVQIHAATLFDNGESLDIGLKHAFQKTQTAKLWVQE
jgi:hypothetical protein